MLHRAFDCPVIQDNRVKLFVLRIRHTPKMMFPVVIPACAGMTTGRKLAVALNTLELLGKNEKRRLRVRRDPLAQ